MPDRLDILRHQRALVQEQLAWIDREIAELSRQPAPDALPKPVTPPATAPRPALSPLHATPDLPDFPEYQADPASMQRAARRGCLLYAALAFALLIAGAVVLYFVAYRDHPVFFAGEKSAPVSK